MDKFNSERFNRVLRITETFIKIFKVIFMIIPLLAIISLAVLSLVPRDVLTFDGDGLSLSFVFVPVTIESGTVIFEDSIKPLLMNAVVIIAIYASFAYFLFYLLGNIITKTKEKKPFDSLVVNHFFRLAYLLIIGSIVLPIFDAVILLILNNAYPTLSLNIVYSPQMGMFFSGILIYILANVFEYGAALQSEVDATV